MVDESTSEEMCVQIFYLSDFAGDSEVSRDSNPPQNVLN